MFAAVIPSGLRLRPQTEQDREFLCALYARARDEELQNVPWPPETKAAFLRSQFEAQHRHYATQYRDARFDIIERDGPIGRLCVLEREDALRLVDIALLPEWRAKGIGAGLIEDLKTRAKPIALSVTVVNPARRLYERLGFVERENDGMYVTMEWKP
jgi:GNAT superfamily N-acetyltransferase